MPVKYVIPPPEDSAFLKWNKLSVEASIVGGRPWNNVVNYARWMREVGFVEVVEESYFLPVGPWLEGEDEEAKRLRKLGLWQRENLSQGMEGMTVKNLSRIRWEPDESKVLVAEIRKDIMNIGPGGTLRPYTEIMAIWGRKPTKTEGNEGAETA